MRHMLLHASAGYFLSRRHLLTTLPPCAHPDSCRPFLSHIRTPSPLPLAAPCDHACNIQYPSSSPGPSLCHDHLGMSMRDDGPMHLLAYITFLHILFKYLTGWPCAYISAASKPRVINKKLIYGTTKVSSRWLPKNTCYTSLVALYKPFGFFHAGLQSRSKLTKPSLLDSIK